MFRKSLPSVYNLYKILSTSRNYVCHCKATQINVSVLARTQTIVKTSVANMSNGDREIAEYEDVVSATKNDTVYIIDVREPSEVKEGAIPNSINIPLAEVENALRNLSDEDFKKKYGRDKPTYDTPIIFSCRSGRRAGVALDTVKKLGFNNLRNYEGSWLDWESKLNQ